MKEKNKFLNGEITVSHWDGDLNLISSSIFKSFKEANKFFEEWK